MSNRERNVLFVSINFNSDNDLGRGLVVGGKGGGGKRVYVMKAVAVCSSG